MNPQAIARGILGTVEWRDATTGYCACPGAHLHTTPAGKRDARVTLDGAPTIFCFHSSCQVAVEAANLALRRALAKGEATAFRPTKEQVEQQCKRDRERAECARLQTRAKASLQTILAEHDWPTSDIWESSPSRLLEDPAGDWRLLLQLFSPGDVLWIGDVKDSCPNDADDRRKRECARHFRPVSEWLKESQAPGQFTCPSVFKSSVHSRSNENVAGTPFLVVESDILHKEQLGAVFYWAAQFLRLRAIVDTGGKSLHGWFDRPTPEAERELKTILPELGCDPALFKPSQPCRLPGAKRGDKVQSLLYLDI